MFSFHRRASETSRTAIVHSNVARAVAVVTRRAGVAPRLVHAVAEGRPKSGLAWRATQAMLQSVPTRSGKVSAVLPPTEYQMMLIEAPSVPDSELRDALRWKVRDQISTPIEQSVIDVFRLPEIRGQSNLVQVVVTTSAVVEEIEAIVKGADRGLDVIDIPELALRNLTRLLPQDDLGCVLLLISRGTLHILLTVQGVLYVARRVELTHGGAGDQVAVELQRSLQYYESQFDRPPISDVLIGPEGDATDELAAELSVATGLNCTALKLDQVLQIGPGIARIEQPELLLAVGAALRPAAMGVAA